MKTFQMVSELLLGIDVQSQTKSIGTEAILQLKKHFLTAYILVNKFFYKLINIFLKKKFFLLKIILKKILKIFFIKKYKYKILNNKLLIKFIILYIINYFT